MDRWHCKCELPRVRIGWPKKLRDHDWDVTFCRECKEVRPDLRLIPENTGPFSPEQMEDLRNRLERGEEIEMSVVGDPASYDLPEDIKEELLRMFPRQLEPLDEPILFPGYEDGGV